MFFYLIWSLYNVLSVNCNTVKEFTVIILWQYRNSAVTAKKMSTLNDKQRFYIF